MNKSEHEGRRQRMRLRYINEGLEHFEEHEVLEFLLYYSIPYKNTNEIAHNLIKTYGSLADVLDASPDDLINRMKLSERSAILLNIMPKIAGRYMKSRWRDKALLNSVENAGEYCAALFADKTVEEMYLICLNNANKVLTCKQIAAGTVNEAHIYPRTIIEDVILSRAGAVILAHNHPGGTKKASQQDIETTLLIQRILKLIGVKLLDHIIVAGEEYISMAMESLLNDES